MFEVQALTEPADYLGYCEHGVLVYVSSGHWPPSYDDFLSVYQMLRGEYKDGLKTCKVCKNGS